jgi:hypothetical protein
MSDRPADSILTEGADALWTGGVIPFHARLPNSVEYAQGAPFRVVSATPWRSPRRFRLRASRLLGPHDARSHVSLS